MIGRKTNQFRITTVCCFTLGISLALSSSSLEAEPDFANEVAPIFEQHCLGCHNANDLKGGFSLHSSESAFEDGYIVPRDVESSHLLQLITPDGKGQAEMPKGKSALSQSQLAVIRDWIQSGAKWPAAMSLKVPVADLNWWSLQPLKSDTVRDVASARVGNKIDRFVQRKLREKGLTAAEPAARRTLCRRLYYDLWGLPPTPEQLNEFLEDDRPDAYERLVDRLLASDRYGEHWARHWLDVVHYADTHGYDKDKPRPNAWPYRDYVIRAFNEDKPYSRFVREQLAGDILWPDSRDGIVATGFIAAGPWDFIGHAEVPESKIDGKVARNLDRDDMVTSTMNTFCSVTVQCARCHNHKFDSVTQEHYYSLQAVFAALDRADRGYDDDVEVARRRAELEDLRERLESERNRIDEEIVRLTGPELTEMWRELANRKSDESKNKRPEFGYHSQIVTKPDIAKWVQVDLGSPQQIDELRYVGCHDDFNGIGHGFGFPVRYRIEISLDAQFADSMVVVNRTHKDVANPGTEVLSVKLSSPVTGRYVRFTATRLAERSDDYIFALGEFMVLSDGKNVALGKSITALDSIEAPVRWRKSNLVDGHFFGQAANATAVRIEKLEAQISELMSRKAGEELLNARESIQQSLEATMKEQGELPEQKQVYAGTIHYGSGNFAGRGSLGGTPRDIYVLARGDVLKPQGKVGPGALPVIPNLGWQFDLSDERREGDRRVALAEWIVHPQNPLTWRSIVNRVWHYHFGKGLVDSPNDFGRMGKQPTHPELLDWLAIQFRDGNQSFKDLNRLIVMSAAFRQSSQFDESNASSDSDSRYLWRFNRRRLTAEELRDSVLAVSGQLSEDMYGPGFQLFKIERPEHSPHYEYHKHDPDDATSHRRSIYRFIVRSQPDPFLTTLDCADSSQSVAKRDETITALQALSLLNNRFILKMSEHFAARITAESKEPAEQVSRAFELVTGRELDAERHSELVAFTKQHGTANLCRLLFNLNEFVFVD